MRNNNIRQEIILISNFFRRKVLMNLSGWVFRLLIKIDSLYFIFELSSYIRVTLFIF
jgi:hypothetical protein